jgi:hypothetical protein
LVASTDSGHNWTAFCLRIFTVAAPTNGAAMHCDLSEQAYASLIRPPPHLSRKYTRSSGYWHQQTRTGDVMTTSEVIGGDRIIAPMITLAGCTTQHRIIVAGSKSMELMFALHRRGYLRAAATGNCGRPAAQYDVALVDWRRQPLRTLDTTLDWLLKFLSPGAVLVVWIDAQKPAADENLRASIEKRGFVIEQGAIHECGHALSARRRQTYPLQKAA